MLERGLVIAGLQGGRQGHIWVYILRDYLLFVSQVFGTEHGILSLQLEHSLPQRGQLFILTSH